MSCRAGNGENEDRITGTVPGSEKSIERFASACPMSRRDFMRGLGIGVTALALSARNGVCSGREDSAIKTKRDHSDIALPTWVPPPGHFGNIARNSMYDVRPAGWPSHDAAGPFANWSGGIHAADFSTLGAYVVHGSGHLSEGAPLWAGVWCFDLDTCEWVGRNVPNRPLYQAYGHSAPFNEYFESTDPATSGHTYPPHTYDGLIYQSAAMGGGQKGSLLRTCAVGANAGRCVHRFDLSALHDPPQRVIDDINTQCGYPQAALDEKRNGVWVLGGNGNGPLAFYKLSDWSVTRYPGVEFNEYGNFNMVYVPPPWDCLVALGQSQTGSEYYFGVYVSPIVNDVPQKFTLVPSASGAPGDPSRSGTCPSDMRCGGQWSTLLNCIVSYEGKGSYKVHKLTPPARKPVDARGLTAGWTWSSQTLPGVDGVTPSRNPIADNGAWSRFVEAPAARCFIWCDSVAQPVQAWRLSGM